MIGCFGIGIALTQTNTFTTQSYLVCHVPLPPIVNRCPISGAVGVCRIYYFYLFYRILLHPT